MMNMRKESKSFASEIDESTLDFVISADTSSSRNMISNTPNILPNTFNDCLTSNIIPSMVNNRRGSSPYSSVDSSSPSSVGPFDSLDEQSNMSTGTNGSYYTSDATQGLTSDTTNSFKFTSLSLTQDHLTPQHQSSPTFYFNSDGASSCHSTPSSFRSPSGSFSNHSQRPINRQVQTPTATSSPSDEMDFPDTSSSLSDVGLPSSGFTKDGCLVELKLLSQPSRHHRARYRTEGSRGAVKDRSGRSFPIIKLSGYHESRQAQPIKLRCFIGHDMHPGQSHLYYQVSKIVGKNITPSNVIKVDGIKMIEMDLTCQNGYQISVNCIGIVKERNFDVQRKTCNLKRRSNGQSIVSSIPEGQVVNEHPSNLEPLSCSSSLTKRSTTCNLVFTCVVPGLSHPLQVVSEAINCAQILGSPEIHKISHMKDTFLGGSEIFVIGKNFTRDSKIVWDFGDRFDSSFVRESDPESDYINQNHLIFKVPPLKAIINDELSSSNTASGHIPDSWSLEQSFLPVMLRIRCGEKSSDPITFTFINNQVTTASHV